MGAYAPQIIKTEKTLAGESLLFSVRKKSDRGAGTPRRGDLTSVRRFLNPYDPLVIRSFS